MDELLPKVSVIIPCFNGWNYTRECLNSVFNSNYINYDVIVVNDGSTDDTSSSIRKYFPKVEEILGDGNLWWTESMNLGLQKALLNCSDFVLVLNNDVIIDPNTIKNLVYTAISNPKSIIGSLIYSSHDHNYIWSAGGVMNWPWPGELQVGIGEYDNNQYNGIRVVDWTPGMGTLIHTSILHDLNFYDGMNMPQYLSDVDLCLRAKKIGFNVIINSECKIFNNVENTGGISDKTKTFNFKIIGEMFTSYRSPDYFKARLTFISRHCPRHLLIIAILFRYLRLLIFIWKRII